MTDELAELCEISENLHRAELGAGERQAHLARWMRLVGLDKGEVLDTDSDMGGEEKVLDNVQHSTPKRAGGSASNTSWLRTLSDQTSTNFKALQRDFSAFAKADGFSGAPSTADAAVRQRFAAWLEVEAAERLNAVAVQYGILNYPVDGRHRLQLQLETR